MSEFWIAVVLSLIAGLTFIWISVSEQLADSSSESDDISNDNSGLQITNGSVSKSRNILFLLFLSFLIAPIGYYFHGSHKEQIAWLELNQRFSEIQRGGDFDSDSESIQNMMLALRTSIDTDPENGQLWFMLAESYFQLRMIDLADAAIQRAIRIEPKPDWFVANAQILSVRSNEADLSRSIFLLQNALMIQGNHQSALLTLGFIYLRQNDYGNAIAYWEKLLVILKQSGNDTKTLEKQIDFAKAKLVETSKKD